MDSKTEPFSNLSESPECRSCARYILETKGTSIDTPWGESEGVVLNLCEGGMAVLTEVQVEPGSTKRLRFDLPEEAKPVEVEGVVVWEDKKHGRFGIKFKHLSEHAQWSIRRWASQHALHSQLASILYDSGRATLLPDLPGSLPVEQHSPEDLSPEDLGIVPAIPSEDRQSRQSWAPVADVPANPMEVLTKDEAANLLKVEELDDFIGNLAIHLPSAGSSYAIAPGAQAKTALAKFLAYLLLKQSGVCIYLTGWDMRQYSEHLDLFFGYRRSAGETRTFSEAPVHLFNRDAKDALVSILCLVLYFSLEAWIFDVEGLTLIRIGRDGKMDIQNEGEDDIRDFAKDPDKYLAPFLAL